MNLKLRVDWIKKLSTKSVVETVKWRQDDQWQTVDIEELSGKDLDTLLALMAQHKDVKGTVAVKQKIATFCKLKSNAAGTKISRLEPLVMAVKEVLMPTPNKWLFSENEDGHMVPWYVHNVKYNLPDARYGRPANTEINMAATKRGVQVTKTLTFHSDELGDVVSELLKNQGYYIETPEIVQAYAKENERYRQICSLTGTQFTADGEGFEREEYSTEAVSMVCDDVPARVVMDDEDDEGSNFGSGGGENEKAKISAAFWLDTSTDDGGAAEELGIISLPLQPYVKVFNLDKHVFTLIHVANLTEYRYDPTVIDKLILPAESKDLISILVANDDMRFEDIVRGKTGGIIVISTGPAGTGKTLTAEVFSEQVKRPLYGVQCSQLGTDEAELEKELRLVLRRAQRWHAILLIDESDVYVHERGDDIQQNAIVGVFLRVLEYYRGVLFMTSNRETIIDDAIMSRALAWIRYTVPDKEASKAIWQVLSTQYRVKLTDADITKLIDHPAFNGISGRSMKNMLKLAKLMEVHKKKAVDADMLIYVSRFLDLECSKKKPETN